MTISKQLLEDIYKVMGDTPKREPCQTVLPRDPTVEDIEVISKLALKYRYMPVLSGRVAIFFPQERYTELMNKYFPKKKKKTQQTKET